MLSPEQISLIMSFKTDFTSKQKQEFYLELQRLFKDDKDKLTQLTALFTLDKTITDEVYATSVAKANSQQTPNFLLVENN